ncbi:MAG: LapA family protein [Acidimicrobiia bacterium]
MTQEQMQPGKDGGLRLGGGAIASLTGGALLVVFMLQNTNSVKLHFLFWHFTCPVWLLTLASAVLGAFVWIGLGVLRRHRRRKERRAGRR